MSDDTKPTAKSSAKFNGYSLQRRWFNWAFEHVGQHKPAHAAIYWWLLEYANRREWPDEFEMDPQYAMTAAGIGAYNTYKNHLSDLQAWGFIQIRQIGQNQWRPWRFALTRSDEPLIETPDSALSNFNKPLNKTRNKANGNASSNFNEALNEAVDEALDEPLDKALNAAPDTHTINKKPTNPQTSKPSNPKGDKGDADAPPTPPPPDDDVFVAAEVVGKELTQVPAETKKGAGAAKSPKTKDHYFCDSPYYDRATFIDAIAQNPEYAIYDLIYYHESLRNWADSGSSAKFRKTDWLATGRNFMLRDANDGKARFAQNFQPLSTNSYAGNRQNNRNGVSQSRAEFSGSLDKLFATNGQFDDSEGAI